MAASRAGLKRRALLAVAGGIGFGTGIAACAAPSATLPLRGTLWQVLPLQAAEMSPPAPAELRLDPEGSRYSGFTGCNRISGSFELDGPRLRIEPGATTRMACPGEAAAEEARFLAALPRVAAWRFDGAELQLLDGSGQPVLRLRSAPTGR